MDDAADLLGLTADVVSAFVSHNRVETSDLPALIAEVHRTLGGLGTTPVEAAPEATPLTAAKIRKSITPEALISFEDGRAYKTLKRHLRVRGLSFAAYKEKWGLPSDYPSTASAYSEARSAMAKKIGLGRKAKAPKPPRGRSKTV